MTTVSSTTASNAATSSSTATTNAFNKLGEGDFLKLLTTQLSNQDPTQPVDNTQMLAQLAQFSTLAAANTTNSDLSMISGQITAATGVTGLGPSSTSGTAA